MLVRSLHLWADVVSAAGPCLYYRCMVRSNLHRSHSMPAVAKKDEHSYRQHTNFRHFRQQCHIRDVRRQEGQKTKGGKLFFPERFDNTGIVGGVCFLSIPKPLNIQKQVLCTPNSDMSA